MTATPKKDVLSLAEAVNPGAEQGDSARNKRNSPTGRPQRRTSLPRSTRGWSRSIVWSLMGLTVFGLLYGFLAKIDTSISATGKLSMVSGTTEISPPFNGVVKVVYVKDGANVKKGQSLFLLDDDAGREAVINLQAVVLALRQELYVMTRLLGLPAIGNLAPLADDQLRTAEQDIALRRSIVAEAAARSLVDHDQQSVELRGLGQQLTMNESILARMMDLYHNGGLSRLEMERQQEQVYKLDTAYKRQSLELRNSDSRRDESAFRFKQVSAEDRKQLFARYTSTKVQLLDTQRQLAEQIQRRRQQLVIAPASGTIFNVAIKPGEVTGPGRPSLKIVGNGPVQAQVAIGNKDVGFVHPGMAVEVRIDSYPFTEYGDIPGKLTRIGADTLPPDQAHPQERFPATVQLSEQVLKSIRHKRNLLLKSGMSVSVLIQLQKRPMISLVTDRFNSFFDASRSLR